MKCIKCGKDIPDTSVFCPYCGAGQQKDQQPSAGLPVEDSSDVPEPDTDAGGDYGVIPGIEDDRRNSAVPPASGAGGKKKSGVNKSRIIIIILATALACVIAITAVDYLLYH